MNQPKLIIEADNSGELPAKFRMTGTPIEAASKDIPNLEGFAELNISGSGQFSGQGLRSMMKAIGSVPAIIVDLRQESHGMVDGFPVCWFGTHNNANKGLTKEKVLEDESRRLEQLRRGTGIQFDYIEGKSAEVGFDTIDSPQRIQSEAEAVKEAGLRYQRFFVTDHHHPLDSVVDEFIEFVNRLPQGVWLHFHCRGGVGRTTTFMLMYDMMKNAKQVRFEDILERHRLNGGRDMYRLDPSKDSYKYAPAVERLEFIKQFYQYCFDNSDHFTIPWSKRRR